MSTARVKFMLTRPHPAVRAMYRSLREIGLDRYTANMMCVGACTMDRSLGKVELKRPLAMTEHERTL